MNRHLIQDYLNEDTLTPSSDMMGEIANSDWWTSCADMFDDLIWLYYPNRTVFLNERFPYNCYDPDNTTNISTTIDNIKRTFAIFLKSKNYTYSRLYDTIMAEYNPLYNVDAFEFEDTTGTNTGTVDNTKSGSDTNTRSGNETTDFAGTEASTRSGNETVDYEGTETSTRSGNEEDTREGDDTVTNSVTTYDSAAFQDRDKSIHEYPTETHTFNDVADTKEFTDRTDTHTYNDVKDEKSFKDRTDTHTYNDVKDEMSYDSSNLETRDLSNESHLTRRRYGNIGVTKSTELIDAERQTVLYDFYKKVVHDCINMVSYAVE